MTSSTLKSKKKKNNSTMARLTALLLLSALSSAVAFAPSNGLASAPSTTKLNENFGLDFAEDQRENTPDVIFGEANYKQWVGENTDNSFLNRQYNVVRRVRELDLLGLTAEYGILSKLEKNGIDLATIESLLPAAEELGLLSLVGNNQQLLINAAAPLLVEPAPLLLPVVAGALDIGPPAFFLAALALGGIEANLLASGAEIPFVGLSAGVFLGLLLVPLTLLTGGLGVALASAGKK